MNFLEQLITEWYGYKGFFVRNNVKYGKRAGGGYEGEMDVVAFGIDIENLREFAPPSVVDTLTETVKGYERHLSAELVLAESTRKAYLTDLEQYLKFVFTRESPSGAGKSGPRASAAYDSHMIRTFLASEMETRSRTTVARKLASLRAFFAFATRGGTEASPAEIVVAPKLPRIRI